MKVISINTNGIRAAARKGFFTWLEKVDADVICIQETKAQFHQLESDQIFQPKGYHCCYHDAEKKGYSGVAIFSKRKPNEIIIGTGWGEVDVEGRYIEFVYDNLNIASIYMHSGTSGDDRQSRKELFMQKLYDRLTTKRYLQNNYIICGDINIAHTEKDIKNAKGNKNNSGFLPHERDWLSKLFASGYADSFRVVDDRDNQYTWWSNRGQAWKNNTGWRIDYQIISQELIKNVKTASIYKDERFSDHSPLIIDYDIVF